MGPWARVQVGVELLLLVLEGLIVERGVVELLLVELVEGVEAGGCCGCLFGGLGHL